MTNRKMRIIIALVLIVGLDVIGILPATAHDVASLSAYQGDGSSLDFKAGEILVKFKEGASVQAIPKALVQASATRIRTLSGGGVQLWQVPKGQELSVAEQLASDPIVAYAEPNYIYRALETGPDSVNITPNDPSYSKQWAHSIIHSSTAWNITTGSSSVVVAVLDSGADLGHPDLMGKLVAGYDFVDRDSTPYDGNGHGSHVAGIVAATTNNGIGIAGVNWLASIMPVRVLDNSGSGYNSDIVDGIYWAYQNGADVLNLSLGGSSYSQAMQDAVTAAHSAGSLVVAAMGNCRTISAKCPDENPTNYPAAYTNVMAVAATGPTDVYASYSQYGAHCDISAPGGDMSYTHDPAGIYSTMPTYQVYLNTTYGYYQNYDYLNGTSQAAPHVAGLAALILGYKPSLSPDQVQQVIQNTAQDLGPSGWDVDYGYGRIDAGAALLFVAPPDAPTLSPIDNADGDGNYTVAWNLVLNATSYTLQESNSSAFTSATTIYSGPGTQYAVSGKASGTTWYYRVRASNANGTSPWSSIRSVAIKPATPLLSPISNASHADAYAVNWSAAIGATEYTLLQSLNSSCTSALTRYKGTALQYNVTGQPGGTWYYCVKASNAAGDSPLSAAQSTIVDPPALSPPVLNPISNDEGEGNYTISWSAVATSPVTYTLEASSEPYFANPTAVYSGSALAFSEVGKPAGTWFYRVRAFGQSGKSPWSVVQSTGVDSLVYLPFVTRNYTAIQPANPWKLIFEEDFEGTFPSSILWDIGDNNGAVGGEYYWGKRTCLPYEGSYSAWAVGGGWDGSKLACGGGYPNSASSWMTYGPFSLSDATDAHLVYQAWVNVLSPGDTLCHMASVNGSDFLGSCTTGLFPQAQWTERTFDLTNVYTLGDLSGEPQVWIALIFESDILGAKAHGAYVDNLLLEKLVGAAAVASEGGTESSPVSSDWDVPAMRTVGH